MKLTTMFHHLSGLVAGLLLAIAAAMSAPSAHAQGCSGDLNGDGRVDGADLATVLSQWGNCPPGVTAVTPAQGSVLGGTVVTITGTGLAATTGVTVGGAPCTNLVVLTPTQIRATTPAGVAGQAPIAVTTPSGTSLSPIPFTYVMQSVSSIVPSKGPYLGGTAISIQGENLSAVTAVTIGGVSVASLEVSSSTLLTAITPPGSLGSMDVVITGAKGNITLPGGFTFVSPPPWATVLEWEPDPAVVTSVPLREAIIATGLPWRVRDNSTQIEMLLVPPGAFNMGCSGSIQSGCVTTENPVHLVTLTNPFYLGRFEVTQAQWTASMGSNPSYFVAANGLPGSSLRPVERVWMGAVQAFLSATGFRLPTEAEWEFACRAGTSTAFHSMPGEPAGFIDETLVGSIAWFDGNTGSFGSPTWGPRAVGQKAANALGFHDMTGNVWEWVSDWYSPTYYTFSPSVDPTGPATGTIQVLRGGAFTMSEANLRSSVRWTYNPAGHSGFDVGFRVARNP